MSDEVKPLSDEEVLAIMRQQPLWGIFAIERIVDARDAEIAALRARVQALELAKGRPHA